MGGDGRDRVAEYSPNEAPAGADQRQGTLIIEVERTKNRGATAVAKRTLREGAGEQTIPEIQKGP